MHRILLTLPALVAIANAVDSCQPQAPSVHTITYTTTTTLYREKPCATPPSATKLPSITTQPQPSKPHSSSEPDVECTADPKVESVFGSAPVKSHTLSPGSSGSWSNTTTNSTDIPTRAQTSLASATSQLQPQSTGNLGRYPVAGNTTKGLKNALYFTNWGIYARNYLPSMIPVDKITHLLYAFAGVDANGTVISIDPWADEQKQLNDTSSMPGSNVYGCVKEIYLHKKKHRNLKTLLSIGGWTASDKGAFNFAASDTGRRQFARSAVSLMSDWGMDGLDVDWEYPKNAEEAQQYVQLLEACRKELDDFATKHRQKYHYLLTVASSAGPNTYNVMDLKGMDRFLDAWNLMAYDYAGDWSDNTGHLANLHPNSNNPNSTVFSTAKAVGDYLAAGISPHKLIIGLPLYGRSFEMTLGLGKKFHGVGPGKFEKGVWPYNMLPKTGATVELDDAAGAAWSYDAGTKELISHEDPRTVLIKSDYIKDNGLGGAFWWEASGDKTGDESLVGAMAKSFGTLEFSENMLDYPSSRFDNIRRG
ncbi:endochitinase [Drechmeria coniospora]|uniref:chitinase n=1 Tax=Drechmeria coniospora TaxID=98403 RepID=A0A151GEK3_DRECN|nr:endochitinase [Drechmeria coniospora]KYK55524.1 endochitinase [Drechmeria coniospora]